MLVPGCVPGFAYCRVCGAIITAEREPRLCLDRDECIERALEWQRVSDTLSPPLKTEAP